MTVSLKLNSGLYACPANWVRFIEDLEDREVEQTISGGFEIDTFSGGFEIDTLNQELKPFKAQYIPATRVDFASEKYYTMFVLKYGGE